MTDAPPLPRPSSTVALLRDGPGAAEVFMVTRHKDSRVMGGALVFPGGVVDPADIAWAEADTDGGFDDVAYRMAAIRELFEETGFLLARKAGDEGLLPADHATDLAARHRASVHSGALSLGRMLADEGLVPALSALILFAHWITPLAVRARFDTRFYAAAAPPEQLGLHDGTELIASRWVAPQQALDEAAQGLCQVVLPTRLNLMLMAAPTAQAALDLLAARHVAPILPEVFEGPDGRMVRLPAWSGYPATEYPNR